MSTRYPAPALREFASRLLQRAGLAAERAAAVADILVEGDLMGHSTHGLQLLGPYLKALTDGTMTRAGEPEAIADRGRPLHAEPARGRVSDRRVAGADRHQRLDDDERPRSAL